MLVQFDIVYIPPGFKGWMTSAQYWAAAPIEAGSKLSLVTPLRAASESGRIALK